APGGRAGPGVARALDPPRRPLHARQRHVDDLALGAGGGHGRRRSPLPPATPPRRRGKDRLQELRAPLPLALSLRVRVALHSVVSILVGEICGRGWGASLPGPP